MEEIENKKKRATLDKERQHELTMERVKQMTETDHKRKSERTKLKQADKKEAVERLMRVREYERQIAVQRLQDDDARTTALQDFKDKMLEERKAFKYAQSIAYIHSHACVICRCIFVHVFRCHERNCAHIAVLTDSTVPCLPPVLLPRLPCPSSASLSFFNRRQNDLERYRVIQSMEKMRQNPAKAVQGSSRQIQCFERDTVRSMFTYMRAPNAFLAGVCARDCRCHRWLACFSCRDHLESATACVSCACSPISLSCIVSARFFRPFFPARFFPPVFPPSLATPSVLVSFLIFPLSSCDPSCLLPPLHLYVCAFHFSRVLADRFFS